MIDAINEQATQLGYAMAQVEEMFAQRVRYEHSQITLRHTRLSIEMMKAWLNKELDDEAYAEHFATLAMETSMAYDHLKMNHAHNISHLNSMVLDSVEKGKNQQISMSIEIDNIFNGDE